jgi:hypothetical protein
VSTVWVKSWRLPAGTGFGVSVQVEGMSWGVLPDQVGPYAALVVRRSIEAEHDAAVLSLLTSLGLPLDEAVQVVARDIRPERVTENEVTAPLTLEPGVAAKDDGGGFRPFLKVIVDGLDTGQWSPRQARQHAMAVLSVLAAADLDSVMERVLVGTVGLDRPRASAVIHGLAEHWPDEELGVMEPNP